MTQPAYLPDLESADSTAQPLFLNLDDDFSLAQSFGQARTLTQKLLILLLQQAALRLRSAFLWSQSLEDSVGPLPSPGCQQRRAQASSTEEGTDATGCARSGFGFLQDAQFVFRGEGMSLRFSDHFGIRPRGWHQIGAPEDRTLNVFPFISSFFFLALLIN